MCLKELAVAVFMLRGILFKKDFRVVNTQGASVQKQFKRSTLNFAHTVLTSYFTKV